ncbi:MAG: hypothetical protein L6435_01585, partial [Anaerolineae bacterium]|nr:hypothetical protein [Anaerolineae bacterium]
VRGSGVTGSDQRSAVSFQILMGEGLLTAAPLRTLGQETFANREAANTSVGQGLLSAAPVGRSVRRPSRTERGLTTQR